MWRVVRLTCSRIHGPNEACCLPSGDRHHELYVTSRQNSPECSKMFCTILSCLDSASSRAVYRLASMLCSPPKIIALLTAYQSGDMLYVYYSEDSERKGPCAQKPLVYTTI